MAYEIAKAEGFAIATQGEKVKVVLEATLVAIRSTSLTLIKSQCPLGGIAWKYQP